MSTNPVRVLITGVGGGGFGHEVLKALRLAATPYRVIVADMNPRSFGLRDGDASHVLLSASHPEYVDAVARLCHDEAIQVVIPGSEPEIRRLSPVRQSIERTGAIVLINASSVLDIAFDKLRTVEALRAIGVASPRSALVLDDDIEEVAAWCPVVVKPVAGAGGSALAFIAQDADELRFFVRYLQRAGAQAIVQEYVGDATSEYTVGVLHTRDGVLAGSLALHRDLSSGLSRRLAVRARSDGRMLTLSSGISQGVIEQAPEIRGACERIATALGSTGPLNVQLRVVDGAIVPFEINPRFSGTGTFRALAGFNEADILIRHHVLGEPLRQVAYTDGVAVRALVERVMPADGAAHA